MYKITQKKKVGKLFWAILPILMLALMATFFIIPKTQNRQVNAFTSSATEGFVTVGELFNGKDAEYKFSGANLKSLFNKLSENGSGNISTLTSDITTNGNKTAETIRGYNDSNSVVVTLGGLEWIVTYVSKDTDGNVIATLWLTNNEQDAWSGKSQNLGLHYGFANGGLYADWAADWYSSSTSGTYVSAMYGTSYIRSVVLNNGGSYATSTSAVSSYTKSTDGSNPFELFTVPANGLTDYIVAPEKVAWQKTIDGQDKSLVGFTYDCSNNALSNTPASGSSYTTKFYSSAYDYSNKTGYANWGTDKLWLPSITETGYSDTNDGLWETVVAERQNYDGSTTSFTASTLGSSQSNYGTTAYTSSWLRSGDTYFSYFAYVLDPSGGSYGSIFVYRSQAVRPALHLNLTSAALSAAPALDDGNGSISVADLTYTGSTLTPSVTVKYNGTTLTKDTDYTLTYSPTTIKNAGTYDVTATGMGDYEGSISTTFTVNAKSITTAVLSSASEQIYNGEDQTGNIVIEDNGKILQHTVDYDLVILGGVYDEPVMNEVIKDAGEYRITVNGIGNYDDVLSFTFNITAKSIAGVSFSAISAQTYTGSALTPSFTVTDTDRGVALTKTTDYTVGYSNNTNVGTATVTITGAGNYTGSASTTFTINPKSIADVTVSDIPNQTYTGSALTPAITVTDGGTTLNKTTDYTLEYRKDSASGTVVTSIVDVGTYYIKVVGAGNYTSSITKLLWLMQKALKILNLAQLQTKHLTTLQFNQVLP